MAKYALWWIFYDVQTVNQSSQVISDIRVHRSSLTSEFTGHLWHQSSQVISDIRVHRSSLTSEFTGHLWHQSSQVISDIRVHRSSLTSEFTGHLWHQSSQFIFDMRKPMYCFWSIRHLTTELNHDFANQKLFNGACVHYVMVSKFQWKPFCHATQRDPPNDWTATQNRVNYDVIAQASLHIMHTLFQPIGPHVCRHMEKVSFIPRDMPGWLTLAEQVQILGHARAIKNTCCEQVMSFAPIE